VAEMVALIAAGNRDERLDWKTRNRVRILVGKIVPATNRQTTSGRRRRFWAALDRELGKLGWKRKSSFVTRVENISRSMGDNPEQE
jgi:hypothetical protein